MRPGPKLSFRLRRFGKMTAMSKLARVVEVESLGDFRLRLTFSDGMVRELDFDGVLVGGVFEPLADPQFFARASVDGVAGTISWPNGVDLDPDVLHGDHEPERAKPHDIARVPTPPDSLTSARRWCHTAECDLEHE